MKRLTFAALVAGGIALSSSAAVANVEVGATAGVHVFSTNNELGVADVEDAESMRNSALFGIRLGYYLNDLLGIEVEAGAVPTEPRGMVFDIWNLTFRGQVVAQLMASNPKNKFVPFALAGGGVMQVFKSDEEDVISKDTDELFYAGAGVKYRVDNGWGLRLDLRVVFAPSSASESVAPEGEGLLSVYKEFGRKAVEKEPEPEPEGPKDTDGDGITDDKDECPDKAEDVDQFEDENGCPDEDNDKDGVLDDADQCKMEAEDPDGFEDENGCPETDNDKDGILDEADQCKNEAEDVDQWQDEDGCPDPDNDGDGVLDAADNCKDQPETVNGFQDGDGCPDEIPPAVKKFTGVIKGINFKTGEATILKTSNKTLDATVKILNDYPDLKLEIQGHTDNAKMKKGSTFANNDELSQARADAVKTYMVTKGIADERLVAKGYGEQVPLDPRNTKAAKAKNRRVEFKLISDLQGAGGGEAPPPPAPAPNP
jgi:OOP family OmpA-OmpF porin